LKVAVLGHTPAGLEMTLKLMALGSEVRWYGEEDYSLTGDFELGGHPDDLTSRYGREHLGLSFDDHQKLTTGEYFRHYFEPLFKILEQKQIAVRATIKSVSKCHLLSHETPGDKTRFADLFRVIYSRDPEKYLEQLKKENSQVYEKFKTTMDTSFGRELEMFDDVDIVIENLDKKTSSWMGPSAPAVGEKFFKTQLTYLKGSALNQKFKKEILVVGSGEMAALALMELTSWLDEADRRIFLVSTESTPFLELKQSWPQSLNEKLENSLKHFEDDYKKEMSLYEGKVDEWQEMEPHLQAKLGLPALPYPKLVIFSGHMVTSVDRLADQDRFFVTLEKTPWRESLTQPENSTRDLKTISVDHILVGTGKLKETENYYGLNLAWSMNQKNSVGEDGKHPEMGFYSLTKLDPKFQTSWKKSFSTINQIENNLLTLFSRTMA
jgi:hypothetical protein